MDIGVCISFCIMGINLVKEGWGHKKEEKYCMNYSQVINTILPVGLISYLWSIPLIKKNLFTHLDCLLFAMIALCSYFEVIVILILIIDDVITNRWMESELL